jgi:hypothetical protein
MSQDDDLDNPFNRVNFFWNFMTERKTEARPPSLPAVLPTIQLD